MINSINVYIIIKVLGVVFCCALWLGIGYFIGKRKGIVLGMEQLLSIIKVYDQKLAGEIGSVLHEIGQMTDEEKEAKFKEYLERNNT